MTASHLVRPALAALIALGSLAPMSSLARPAPRRAAPGLVVDAWPDWGPPPT